MKIKRYCAILAFILAIGNVSFSQVFADKSAVIHYSSYSIGDNSIGSFFNSGDTIVNGDSLHFFYRKSTFRNIATQEVTVYPANKWGQLFKVSNDTVSILKNGQFYVQYRFNALPGDTFFYSTDILEYIVVDSTYDTLINNVSLRTLKLRNYYDTIPHFRTDLVIERIGCVTNAIFPVFWDIIPQEWIGFYDGNRTGLRCYYDSILGFAYPEDIQSLSPTYCDGSLSVEYSESNAINLKTNLVTDAIYIDGLIEQQAYKLSLYNTLGTLVKQQFGRDSSLPVFDIPQGMYFLKVESQNRLVRTFKVFKN